MRHEEHELFRTVAFPFPEGRFPRDLGAVVQRTVAEGDLPALTVVHDTDGDWLVGDGVNDPNLPGACIVHCLVHLAEADPSLAETATLPPGYAAYRDGPDQPWSIEPFSYEDGSDVPAPPAASGESPADAVGNSTPHGNHAPRGTGTPGDTGTLGNTG
ncbi:hypothetical protein ACFYYR_00345 [Streptomyces sp. NPDC001922]|uniref:hypothetical protein n=1 Tax=Streptomyces sp. NPDC001922 TaxID=3364624 RepID=UPI0036C969B2